MSNRLLRTTTAAAALTLGLSLFFVVGVLALNAALWLVCPEPYNESGLQHSWTTLRGQGGDDSWGAMNVALDHARSSPEVPLYTQIFFAAQYRFQYPPSALFALMAMRVAPGSVQVTDFYEGAWPPVNTVLGWIFIALTVVAAVALLESGLRRTQPGTDWKRLRSVRIAVAAALALTFYPIVKAFTLGQIQVWLNGGFALALLAWVAGRKISSGVLLGAVALVKPHYGLILVWAVLRRELHFAAACAATIGVGLAASLAVFGWANHLDYVKVLSFLSQHGEAYYPNQSVNGLLNRLMSLADPLLYVSLDLPAGKFPAFNPWIYAATLATSAAFLLTALMRRSSTQEPDRALDFSTMVLSCTMASPIAWEHHYGVLLPIYALMLPTVLHDRNRLIWLAASYLLVSTFLPVTNTLSATPLNVAQSSLFAGALIFLVLLHTRGLGATLPLDRAAVDGKGDANSVSSHRVMPRIST